MSMWFMGLAVGYSNDSEIIPLQEAVYISPACGRLEMGRLDNKERNRGEAEHRQNGFPHWLICPCHKYTHIGNHLFFFFSLTAQADAQLNGLIEIEMLQQGGKKNGKRIRI